MKEEMNTTKPARAKDLASLLRNPLVIFGLILLAGDGPLIIAYGLTSDPVRAWLLLVAIVALTFGMAGFFCYLVAYKPRHLYAPGEIPGEAIGKSLYRDEIVTTTAARAEIAKVEKPQLLSGDALRMVIKNLDERLCWFLLKVANKDMGIADEFRNALVREIDLYSIDKDGFNVWDAAAMGYFWALVNFDYLIFEYDVDMEENTIIFKLSTEVLNMIMQRLRPELANNS